MANKLTLFGNETNHPPEKQLGTIQIALLAIQAWANRIAGDIQTLQTEGVQGATGPQGNTGATGAQGIPGVISGTYPIIYTSGTQTVSIAPYYLPLTGGTLTGNVSLSGSNILPFASGTQSLGSIALPVSGVYAKDGYFTNLHGMSPITLHDNLVPSGSNISLGTTSVPFQNIYGTTISGNTILGTFSGTAGAYLPLTGGTLIGNLVVPTLSGTTLKQAGLTVINSGVGLGNVTVTNDDLGKLTISGTQVTATGLNNITASVAANALTVSGSLTPTFTSVSATTHTNNFGIPSDVPLMQQGPKLFYQITPLAATTVTTIGGTAGAVAATLSEPAWNAAYGWGQLASTSTVVGNNAGVTGGVLMFAYLSGNSTIGNMGWTHRQRIHQPNAVTGVNSCRIVAGMTSTLTATTTVGADTPAAISYAILQSCTASGSARQDATWQIAVANAGAQTLINTTLPQTAGSVYDLFLSMPNVATGGNKTLNWQLKNLTSNTQASGTSTATNLPPPSVAMCPIFQIATVSSGVSTAATLRYSYNYTESIL